MTAGASVVIPTIGRPAQLERCLEALSRCQPPPDEIVVVDQSAGSDTSDVVRRYGDHGARVVASEGVGRGLAVNEGLRAAVHDLVLVTDDDCVVAPDWIAVGVARAALDPSAIVTGRVLAGEGEGIVPSVIEDREPHDYSGELRCRALYAGNMVASRQALLDFGGFDERVVPSSEDNDLCYRWLKAGRRLRYEPDLVVTHNDWRTKHELEETYVTYAHGQGVFYAKHLRRGDLRVLRFLLKDAAAGILGLLAGLRGRPRWSDTRQGIARGLPRGLVQGWRAFSPRSGR